MVQPNRTLVGDTGGPLLTSQGRGELGSQRRVAGQAGQQCDSLWHSSFSLPTAHPVHDLDPIPPTLKPNGPTPSRAHSSQPACRPP